MSRLPALPSLQALRILESAVRHKSFTGAARELGLTHGAVSRQIQALEGRMGVPLFQRNGPRLTPTEAAIATVARTTHALRALGEAFEQPQQRPAKDRLRLATTASFARFWLAPRLTEMTRAPKFQIAAIETGAETVPLGDKFDAAIRYGRGAWPGAEARELGCERSVPVASPALAHRLGVADAADIPRAPLIDNAFVSWRAWMDAADLPPTTGLNVVLNTTDSGFALDAAAAGAGVALARTRLAAGMISRGELVALSSIGVDDGYSYYLAWSPETKRKGAINALGVWLTSEFAADSARLNLPAIDTAAAAAE